MKIRRAFLEGKAEPRLQLGTHACLPPHGGEHRQWQVGVEDHSGALGERCAGSTSTVRRLAGPSVSAGPGAGPGTHVPALCLAAALRGAEEHFVQGRADERGQLHLPVTSLDWPSLRCQCVTWRGRGAQRRDRKASVR